MAAAFAFIAIAQVRPLGAQTDYFNTDAGRPLTIEDAYATERYAFELQIAPLRLERMKGGTYRWEVEPEIAYGILPRTHIELGLPISYLDGSGGAGGGVGVAGIVIGLLHNLNVETKVPALAVAGDVHLPVGSHAPDAALASVKAIATKTLGRLRFHLNGEYSFGSESVVDPIAGEVLEQLHGDGTRWLAGIAADRTFPLRSTLVGAEVFASQGRDRGTDPTWNAAIGFRRQLSPAVNIDMGVGKQLTGDDRAWFATFGFARAFAIRSLLPGS